MSVPTILFYKGGENVQRISSDEVTLDAIREGAGEAVGITTAWLVAEQAKQQQGVHHG